MGDLPDFITGVETGVLQAASLVNGADAAKATYPAVGDVYLATDTQKLYICVAAGAWTGFDASILIQGILTLYADVAGGGFEIKNIKDPTAAQSAATRAYVLSQLAGYLTQAHETATTGIHGVGASTIDSVALREAAVSAEATARAAADALRLLLSGGTMSGPIAMGANKITGLADPENNQDAVTLAYVAGLEIGITKLSELTIDADKDWLTFLIKNIGAPVDDQDAATKKYVDDLVALYLLLTGGTMSGPIAMGGNKVTGLGAPTAAQDAATRAYVLSQLAGYLTQAHETATTGIHGVGASTIDSVALREAAISAEATARANADALRLLLSGGTMSGPIAMGGNKVTGLGTPTAAADAARKTEVDALVGKFADVSHSEPSRSLDSTYRNTSGKIRLVTVTARAGSGGHPYIVAYCDATSSPTTIVAKACTSDDYQVPVNCLTFIVPVNYYYEIHCAGGSIEEWHEWDLH
ncbi:hypothetical protein ES708_09260 [subsurface metagenome]